MHCKKLTVSLRHVLALVLFMVLVLEGKEQHCFELLVIIVIVVGVVVGVGIGIGRQGTVLAVNDESLAGVGGDTRPPPPGWAGNPGWGGSNLQVPLLMFNPLVNLLLSMIVLG